MTLCRQILGERHRDVIALPDNLGASLVARQSNVPRETKLSSTNRDRRTGSFNFPCVTGPMRIDLISLFDARAVDMIRCTTECDSLLKVDMLI